MQWKSLGYHNYYSKTWGNWGCMILILYKIKNIKIPYRFYMTKSLTTQHRIMYIFTHYQNHLHQNTSHTNALWNST